MINVFLCLIACFVILLNVFYSFPTMGHDFSLVVSWAHDYHVAWNKFHVFNIQFSPQRCLGIPVWANPIGVNFSFFHFLSAVFTEIPVIIIFILTYVVAGYYGTKKLMSLFDVDEKWSLYFAFAWCLQGPVLMHSLEGHLSYLSILLWPLYVFLILKKYNNRFLQIGSILLLGVLLAHDFYSGAPPLYVQFPLAFFFMLLILKMNDFQLSYRRIVSKVFCAVILSGIIILPKVIAMFDFTRNFQRNTPFINIGILNGFKYTLLSQLFPPIVDYRQLSGWWYGDWESMNYLFPGLILIIFIVLLLKFKKNLNLFFSLSLILLAGTFVASGIYSDFVLQMPVVKSFHVNPRWCIFLTLSYFVVAIRFLKIIPLNRKIIPLLMIYSCALPFFIRDPQSLQLNYVYQHGLDVKENRLNYCYEPVFGYRLELFPHNKVKPGKMMDPRCYLMKNSCNEMSLSEEESLELSQYRLKPLNALQN